MHKLLSTLAVAGAALSIASLPPSALARETGTPYPQAIESQSQRDMADAWQAYQRAFTDGCWTDFSTSPRHLATDGIPSETSQVHPGQVWVFGYGEGC